jgi:hypothetical protein
MTKCCFLLQQYFILLIYPFLNQLFVSSFSPLSTTATIARFYSLRQQQQQQTKHNILTELKMASNNNKILVVGSANQDLTSNTDVLPVLGETVMGKDFATACGGKGANQAVAAGMLGLAPGTCFCFDCCCRRRCCCCFGYL